MALDQDWSFREGERARSGLARSMMQCAVTLAAGTVADLGVETGEGGVCLVHSVDREPWRHYRVLSAKKHEDSYRILSSSDSILGTDNKSMFAEENWVLGYALDQDNQVEDLFVAHVLGRREGNPGELILGPEYMLTGRPPTGDGGFQPTDEDLPMDDVETEGEAGAADAR